MLQDNKPQENIWYYLKRQCVDSSSSKSIRDSLTSSFSIFSGSSTFDGDATSCSGSYLAPSTDMTASDVPGSYVSVYGGSTQDSSGGSIYGSVYATNKISSLYISNTLTADSYVKDSFWRDTSTASLYSIPSSASSLTNNNNNSTNSSSNNINNSMGSSLNNSTSVSGYIDAFSDIPTPPQTNATSNSTTGLSVSSGSNGSSAYSSPYDLSFRDSRKSNSDAPQNLQNNSELQKLTTQIQDQGITNKSTLPWNESFQELLDRPVNSHEEERVRNHNISHFSQILADTAKKYIKSLVREVHIAPELKSIKPFEAGGFAGGEKFRIDNMFIKFALNPHQIYERNNPVSYFANKAAGHELKSINALVSCGVPNLHFPLMCLINYRGFRLIVISELPINSSTLVFGSSNAGETVKENDTVFKMMVKIGEILNLKTHLVEERGKVNGAKFTIPLAIDIEGHFGHDGRYYVVDTARLFPPETPILGITGGHLYRLFRPEFVKRYETQLCADAFAAFNVVDQEPYNDEAMKANNFLIQQYIPAFLKSFIQIDLKKLDLKLVFHRDGINMRYLGWVLHLLTQEDGIDEVNRFRLQGLVVVEMVARLMRFILFSEMRSINSPDDRPHLDIVVNHLNMLLTEDDQYWAYYISNALVAKYAYTLSTLPEVEKKVEGMIRQTNGLLSFINSAPPPSATNSPFPDSYYGVKREMNFKHRLLKKIIQLTGFKFNEKTLKNYKRKKVTTLFVTDISEIDITVKHMDVSSSFKTFENFSDAELYYLNELAFKSEQLGKDHCQVAITHVHLAELYETYSILTNAEHHYNEAIVVYIQRFGNDDIGTANFVEKLAMCNIKQKKYKEASKNLETVLTIKKKIFQTESIEVADTYDNLAWSLQSQGEYEKSLSYYNQALKIKLEKGGNALSVAKTLNNLGHLLLSNNELDKSLEIFKNVQDIFVKQYGTDHSDVAIALDNIALVYAKKKNYPMAEKYFNDTITIRIKQFGEDSRYVALTKDHLAQLYVTWGTKTKYLEADKLFKECIRVSEKFPDQYLKGFLRYNYSKLFRKKKDKAKESEYLTMALQIFEANNINTDLTPKIKSRLEQLKKTGFTKFKEWLNAPSPFNVRRGNNDIQISQLAPGHMVMSSPTNNSSANSSIPDEWQAILQEAGITEDISKDPSFAQTIQSLIVQEMQNKKEDDGKVMKMSDAFKMFDLNTPMRKEARSGSWTSSAFGSAISKEKDKKEEKKEKAQEKGISSVCEKGSVLKNTAVSNQIAGILQGVNKTTEDVKRVMKKSKSGSSPPPRKRVITMSGVLPPSVPQESIIPQLFPQKSPADISPITSPNMQSLRNPKSLSSSTSSSISNLSDSINSLGASQNEFDMSSPVQYEMELEELSVSNPLQRSRLSSQISPTQTLSTPSKPSAASPSLKMSSPISPSIHFSPSSLYPPTTQPPSAAPARPYVVPPPGSVSPTHSTQSTQSTSSYPVLLAPSPITVASPPPPPPAGGAAPPPPPSAGGAAPPPGGYAPQPPQSYLLPKPTIPQPSQNYYPTTQHYPQQYPTGMQKPSVFGSFYPTPAQTPTPAPRPTTLYPSTSQLVSSSYQQYIGGNITGPPQQQIPSYQVQPTTHRIGTSAYHTGAYPVNYSQPNQPRPTYLPTQQTSYLYPNQQNYTQQYPSNYYYQQVPPQFQYQPVRYPQTTPQQYSQQPQVYTQSQQPQVYTQSKQPQQPQQPQPQQPQLQQQPPQQYPQPLPTQTPKPLPPPPVVQQLQPSYPNYLSPVPQYTPPPAPFTMAQLYPHLSQSNLGQAPLQETKPTREFDNMVFDISDDYEDEADEEFEERLYPTTTNDTVSWPSIQQLRTSDKDRIIGLLKEKLQERKQK